MEQKFLSSLNNAEKSLRIADHLVSVTYSLFKDEKICLQVISELNIFSIYLINAVLQYEYYFKRIQLFTDSSTNLEIFKTCVRDYSFSDSETKSLYEVMRLAKAHKDSPMVFVKEKNVVIMIDGGRTEIVNIDKIKVFLNNFKTIIKKVKVRLGQSRLF